MSNNELVKPEITAELQAIFGIDEFCQWVTTELDKIEQKLNTALSSTKRIELQARYDALKEAKVKHSSISLKKFKKEKMIMDK